MELLIDLGYLDNPIPDHVRNNKSYVAYCNSEQCSPSRRSKSVISSKLGMIKNVSKQTDFCPNCGSALFWTKRGLERCLTQKVISDYGKLIKSKKKKQSL